MEIPPGLRIRAISGAANHGRSTCSNTSEEKTTSNVASATVDRQSVMSAMMVLGMSDGSMLRS